MTATTIRVQMAQRKDTAAGWTAANPILLLGEIGYETDTKKFKIGDGATNWNSLDYLPIPDGSGNLTITGNLEIGSTGSLTFEGSTADGFETTLAVTDPTADRTITLPDVNGTVITTGDTGTVTSTMLADGTIVNADINAAAEIAVSKLANGTANQVLVTDGTDVSWSDNLTLAGDLTVNGTTTTINTQDLLVEDKNIIIGNVDTPTDLTADGGGITLKGGTDKTINWVDSTDAWTLSENVNIASGKEYRIDGTKVLDATSLGSAVVSSSLTSVGTIATGTWQGSAIDAAYLDSTIVTTGDTGTVTSTMIADGTIVDGDVNASAAIAGTKISPDFGSQNVTTTGTVTAAALIPSGSSVPTNGVYLPSANNVAISTNGTGRLFIDASGNVGTNGAPSTTANSFGYRNFELKGASTDRTGLLRFTDSAGTTAGTLLCNEVTGFQFAQDLARPITFFINNTERMRLDSSGRLGLGTSAPQALLDVNGQARFGGNKLTLDTDGSIGGTISDSTTRAFVLSNTDVNADYFGGRVIQVGPDGTINIGGTAGTSPSSYSSPNIKLNPAGSSYFTGGSVGIGTTTISDKLEIRGGAAVVGFSDNTTRTNKLFAGFGYETGGTLYGNCSIRSDYDNTNNSSTLNFHTAAGAGADVERARIDSSGRLLVGTSSARSNFLNTTLSSTLQIEGTSHNTSGISVVRNESGEPAHLTLAASRGTTVGSNTVVQNNDIVGSFSFQGNDGSEFVELAAIKAAVDGTPGADDMPGRLVFSTTADGASSPTERMRVGSTGTLYTFVSGNAGNYFSTNQAAGTTATLIRGAYSATANAFDGTECFKVFSNGNVVNANNSYGSLSDIKLKENIVDASSQWDDLKALQVRNYNFKEGQTHTQIGLIAQEVELVSPGIVTESPDRDEDGNDLGTVTKSVNYSVLYMKAVKALQEAMERIEVLEAKVNALEGN